MAEEESQLNSEQTGDEGRKPESKTFTQEDVNRIANQTKTESRTAAVKELMDSLGIEDVDSAKALLAEATQRREAEKSEAQRAAEAAEQSRKAADSERAQAKAERLAINVERELIRSGVPTDKLDRVARMVNVVSEASTEDIAAEVQTLKTEMPELFASQGAGATHSHVTGRSPSEGTRGEDDPKARATERAKNFKIRSY